MSPYRLAAHLTSAFAIFGGLLWTALSVWHPAGVAAGASATAQHAAASLRRWALPVTALVALTACSGAPLSTLLSVNPKSKLRCTYKHTRRHGSAWPL